MRCPVCASPFGQLEMHGQRSDLTCRLCATTWMELDADTVPLAVTPGQCPCCACPVIGPASGMLEVYADAGPGDRYCSACDWVIVREFAWDGGAQCPTHKQVASELGDRPGAAHRWAGASLA